MSESTTWPRRGRSGLVYFARAGDCVKIGWSENPAKRVVQLQTACPDELVLLGALRGTHEDEGHIHGVFAWLRVRGEWFTAAPELLAGVKFVAARSGTARELADWAASMREAQPEAEQTRTLVERAQRDLAAAKALAEGSPADVAAKAAMAAELAIAERRIQALEWLLEHARSSERRLKAELERATMKKLAGPRIAWPGLKTMRHGEEEVLAAATAVEALDVMERKVSAVLERTGSPLAPDALASLRSACERARSAIGG